MCSKINEAVRQAEVVIILYLFPCPVIENIIGMSVKKNCMVVTKNWISHYTKKDSEDLHFVKIVFHHCFSVF